MPTAHFIPLPASWIVLGPLLYATALLRAPRLRNRPNDATADRMFNLVSLIIGVVALICAIVAFIPLLGALNWLIIPLAMVGAVIGMISRGTAGRNLNLFVIVIGVVRLILGHGIL